MGEDACRVCGNSSGNRLHRAREMFAGIRDEFDLVLANHSLEHLADARAALGDVHRLLKPGHYAVVRLPVVARAN